MAVTPNYEVGQDKEDYVANYYSEYDMIGKIARQVIKGVFAKNPLSRFIKGKIDDGDTIEQAVVKMVESQAYDANGENTLAPKSGEKIVAEYFNTNTRKTFKQTVRPSEIRKVLANGKDESEISARLVSAMAEGDIYEYYQNIKGLINFGMTEDDNSETPFIKLEDVNIANGYKPMLSKIKNTVKAFKYVTDSFNKAGIKRNTVEEDIYIIAPYKLITDIDVDELSGVFNLDKAEIREKIIEIDTDEKFVVILDQNALQIWEQMYEMWDQKNAEGAFWNYYLQVNRLFGICTLYNAVFFNYNDEVENENEGE